jgi:hypothetical protein
MDDLFTVKAMLTLTGATGATVVVGNGCQAAFNFNPRWLALATAMAISMFAVYHNKGGPSDYFVGVVNGFLIFLTAVGANTMSGKKPGEGGTARGVDQPLEAMPASAKRRFTTRWY